MYKFDLKTHSRSELIDITREVEKLAAKDGIKDGVCTVFVPHTTAGITINENADPTVKADILNEVNKIVPFDDDYEHSEGNSAAHIKASIIGSSVSIIIEDAKLQLGTWQGIYFCEFDGPRSREIWVALVGN